MLPDYAADPKTGAQAGKNAVENNFLSGDMFALDRKVKAAKEKGEDIEPILEDARKQAAIDRSKIPKMPVPALVHRQIAGIVQHSRKAAGGG